MIGAYPRDCNCGVSFCLFTNKNRFNTKYFTDYSFSSVHVVHRISISIPMAYHRLASTHHSSWRTKCSTLQAAWTHSHHFGCIHFHHLEFASWRCWNRSPYRNDATASLRHLSNKPWKAGGFQGRIHSNLSHRINRVFTSAATPHLLLLGPTTHILVARLEQQKCHLTGHG